MSNQGPNVEKLWKALAKYNIYNEEQLNAAVREMKPLNISCMVSKPRLACTDNSGQQAINDTLDGC